MLILKGGPLKGAAFFMLSKDGEHIKTAGAIFECAGIKGRLYKK